MTKRHYKFIYRSVLLAGACFPSVTSAIAQDINAAANTQAETEADTGRIGEIIVTAQKRSENAQKVPISITALSADALQKDGGIRNALDLTRAVPGLQVQALFQQSNPTIYIRGVGVNNYDSASAGAVGLVFDDVFLNSGVGALFAAFDVDRVEVLKGPQGTLFGRNTTGGVINYTTKRPSFDPNMSVSATVGRFNQMYLDAAGGAPLIKDKLAFRVSGIVKKRDGWVTNVYDGGDMNNVEVYAGRFQLLFKPSDDLEIQNKVEGGWSGSTSLAIKALGTYNAAAGRPCTGNEILAVTVCSNRITGFKPTANIDEVNSDVTNHRETLTNFADRLSMVWTGDKISLTSITAYVSNVRKLNQDQDGSPFGLISSPIWNEKSRQVSQELRLSSVGNGRFRWVAGLYYLQERLSSITNFDLFRIARPDPNQPYFDPAAFAFRIERAIDQKTESKAIFAQADYELTDQLTLTAGIRYTDDSKKLNFITYAGPLPPVALQDKRLAAQDHLLGFVDSNQSNSTVDTPARVTTTMKKPTWRLALAYQATPDMNVYASYSRGVRSGGYNTNAFFVGEFAEVRPEKIDAFEVGAKTDLFDRHVRLNVAGFYYKYTDQLVFSLYQDPSNGSVAQRLANASSRIYGAEFQLQARPVKGVDLNIGGTYLNAKYTDFVDARGSFNGKRVEKAPTWQLTAGANYTVPVSDSWDARFGVNAAYQSRVYYSPFNTAPMTGAPHATVDLNAGLANTNGLDISLWVKNVVDKRYIIDVNDLTAFGVWFPVYNEPRTFGLTVRYTM